MLEDNLKFYINVSITLLSIHFTIITFCYLLIYGKKMTGAQITSSKRKLRIENKKKKMAALIDIAKLNEHDRQKNKQKLDSEIINTEIEPSPKKLKTEQTQEEDSNKIQEEPPPELGYSGKPKLHGTEFAELKKMLRERTTQRRNLPRFRLRDMGDHASLSIDMDNRCPLFISDLQHLIMYSQVGVHSPYSPARWCALEKYNRLKNFNVLIIENVSLYHYLNHESLFQYLCGNFECKLEVISPFSYRSDIVKDLSMVPLSATQMKKLIGEYGSIDDAVKNCSEIFDTVRNFFPIDNANESNTNYDNANLPPTDKFPRTQLLLSGWQMIEENYPLPIKGLMERKYSEYVLTKEKYKSVSLNSPLLAIDCEMCKTTTGDLELTRVSAVNENHEVFYDTLVKPDNKIVDYLTKYSGINPKMMKSVTKKLRDVQEELRQLLPEDAILVGQSLSNDLHALKMMHPYVIDTSVIYNITGDRTRKTKLQTLAREFLSEKIQVSHQGHCSTEDSLACLKLVQLKLKRHLYFGDAVMGSIYSDQRAYPDIGSNNYATSMLKQCTKADSNARVVGVDDISLKYRYYMNKSTTNNEEANKVTCLSMNSNKEVIKELCANVKDYSLNIGHIRVADNQLDGNNSKVFKTLDKWINEVYEATLSPGFLAVILAGQKDGGNGVCFLKLKADMV